MAAASRPRLAVIGGGMGGVSTAYFCDHEWAVDLFEAQSSLGGNATTLAVEDDGAEVAVDIGAESFHPGTHPTYWRLLTQLGADSSPDVRVEMPGSLAVVDARTRHPLFVSSHPLRTPRWALDFLRFARAARGWVAQSPSSDVTVGEWVDGLAIDPGFRRDVLLPWLASLTCYRVGTVRTQSLLAFLLLFVHIFPEKGLGAPKTYCSRIGLGGVLRMLVSHCRDLTVHTDAPVTRLERADGGWFVQTPGGRHGPYEKVVVNAPPHASRQFLAEAPSALLDVLARHEYYPARMIIHRDPLYMPRRRQDWCTHNAAVDGDTCEATIWLGAFRTNPRTGQPVQLFKSWASDRAAQPSEVVAERTFRHPLLSPATLRAAKQLEQWQGVDGIHFAGHFTTLTDLQETALLSAMEVARALAPTSPRLLSLRAPAGSARGA